MLITIKMKRNRKNLKGKRERINDYDPFEQKKRRVRKFNKNMKSKKDFANQYEHELYIDNYDY